jgi:putative transposase
MQYRRAKETGGTYFFTVNLAERHRTLLLEGLNILRTVLKTIKKDHPFQIDAIVVLPDHLHTIWTLPKGDNDFPKRWMLIKSGFSRCIRKDERISASRMKKGERGIWQRRNWEHCIKDDSDYEHHVNYIHYNPVKHGYVNNVVDWEYSSFHRYVADGLLPKNWGISSELEYNAYFGER